MSVNKRKKGHLDNPDTLDPNEEDDEENLCDMEQCIEQLAAEEEIRILEDTVAPIEDEVVNDGQTDVPPNDGNNNRPQIKKGYEVREGIKGKHINIFGDGRCLFRSVAVYLDSTLRKCKQSVVGWPLLTESAEKETAAADTLGDQTVKMMEQIKDEYYKKNEKMGYSKEHDFDHATLSERMKDMVKWDVYAGEPELIAISHVVEQPITVHQASNELTHG